MENIYVSSEELCRTEDKVGKCRTVRRNAGHMATLFVVAMQQFTRIFQ